jgi:acetyl-CoA decarbonylase/synthase, CODH/ACS complex subunit gamma
MPSGIEILKMLPKTNCGECGLPTCLAFAMNLAAGKAELDSCPHISDEARDSLSESSAPPIREVTIGTTDEKVKIGGETVLFRHEKTFFNKTGLGVLITDSMSDADVDGRIKRLQELKYDRVGLILKAELIAVEAASGDKDKFVALAKKAADASPGGIILISTDPALMGAALDAIADKKPLIYAATADNCDAMGDLALKHKCPLGVQADGIDAIAALTEKLTAKGVKDLMIDPMSPDMKKGLEDQTKIRRLALKKEKALGFPTIAFPAKMTDNYMKEMLIASMYVAKYAGIVILSDIQGEGLFPLLLERLNIYTDPQRPMMTDQGIYPINNPVDDSPLLVTSNFSLTYFIVSGELEASRVPSNLLVLDTEGLSVLTAWAAGKFAGDLVAALMKKLGIKDKMKNKKIIIPGAVAIISGELEEDLGSDWEVIVGPREAAHLPKFLKDMTGG